MAATAKDTAFKAESRNLSPQEIARDLTGTAIVTLLLLIPIVFYRTVMNQGTLLLETRLPLVLGLTAAVVVGRLLLHLFVWQRAPEAGRASTAAATRTDWRETVGKWIGPAMLVAAIFLPWIVQFIPGWERRGLGIAIYIMSYIMLAWGLNIVVGLAGLLDLGYVAFYAVGAYSYALLTTVYLPLWFGDGIIPWTFYIVLPLAGLLAALWGVILGFPVLRLRGDYLAIVTLAFGEIIRLVLINWFWFTKGPQGINVPKATFFGLPFADEPGSFADFFGLQYNRLHFFFFLYYVILGLALLTYAMTNRLRRLPIGRAWEALREDEIACRALGINTTNTKLTAFAIGAMFGGFSGSFFAARQGFVSPESFVYIESALILAIVVLGGLGSQLGIVFAAILIMGSFELFRELGFLQAILPEGVEPIQFRMLCVGLGMVLMMRFRPRGLVTRRDPTVFLKEKKAVSADLVSQGAWLMTPAWSNDPELAVQHLTMRFGGLTAIGDLSFDAGRKQITALIGPNGAGKTTVFNCITGFYKPTEGMIVHRHPGGHDYLLERMDDFRITRHAKVARTFQNIRLFGGMTVLENLMVAQHNALMKASDWTIGGLFGSRRFRNKENEAIERAKHWLAKTGLTDRADDPAADLPYGAQRRLEIARAMCTEPRLLCLDEPAAGLNPRESDELNRLLLSIRDEENLAILLIEHDMSVVMGISDHIVVLDYGRKISDGTPAEIKADPAVIRAYLGVEDENEAPAAVQADIAKSIAEAPPPKLTIAKKKPAPAKRKGGRT